MSENKDTLRSFEFTHDDGSQETFYVAMPTSDSIRKADWHYSKMYNMALEEGMATEPEMLDRLKSKGIIGDEYDRKKAELQIELARTITEMEVEENPVKKGKLAIDAKIQRDRLFEWSQRPAGPLSNTCEHIAKEAKTEYLTSGMIQREDGSRVWKDYDSFLEEKNHRLSIKSRYEVLLWLEGLDQDFLDKTPEDIVLRDLAKKEEEGLLEAPKEDKEEVKEEPPKKKTRKKKKES